MEKSVLLSEEKIVNRIYFVRGKRVMLDRDLAEMYDVLTKVLNQAVKRNLRRFPDDFMFQLTQGELENLISQFVISSSNGETPNLKSQTVTSSSNSVSNDLIFQSGISSLRKEAWGGTRKLPYVFTEQGVAMLSSVLKSDTAIDVNIQIIRVFTRMRELFISQKDVVMKIEKLEKAVLEQNSKIGEHDEAIREVFDVLKQLMRTEEEHTQQKEVPIKKVGYKRKSED
ncbi:MAG: ORF6N domain-containing protein [Bacteroidia bacterium]